MTSPSSSPNEKDELCKVLLIGDSGAGKSCILLRFSDNKFSDKRLCTIGIDFKVKVMDVDNQRVKLQIWDTAGQERFKTITQAYYRSAMGILIVFDLNNQQSFANARNWLQQIEQHTKEGIAKILVGNKSDLEHIVQEHEARSLANEFKIPYLTSSAKSGFNVDHIFQSLARDVMKNKENTHSANVNAVQLNIKKNKGSVPLCCNM